MPLRDLNDAKHWRDRAAEIRVLAEEMKEADARTMMLNLAMDYDKLADRAEDRARRDGKTAPSPTRGAPSKSQ
jgi:hypothetical protein